MRIHFFTAPFYFAFIWFRVQGSGLRVQGSRGGFAATIPMTIHAALFLPPSFGRKCPEGAEVGLHLSTKIGHETKKFRHKN